MNELLSICIPTYNRAEHVYTCISQLIPQLLPFNIPIYVSDNCSTDNTIDYINDLKEKYSYIFYSKNENNMGPDYNFAKVLKLSQSKYAWLLGDDDRINDKIINNIME